MVIRKTFKGEMAHIVRQCSSKRCSKSVHGHSFIVEFFLTSNKLDRGGMVIDFGLLKDTLGQLIDSFDHTMVVWDEDNGEYVSDMLKHSDRWISLPVNPTAENFAILFLILGNKILRNTEFQNDEGIVSIQSVRYHETATGYAEAFNSDISLFNGNVMDVTFSDGIKDEWKFDWWDMLKNGIKFVNPKVI